MAAAGRGGAQMLVEQSFESVAVEQRDVGCGDEDRALEVVRECSEAALDGVPGAELAILDGSVNRATEGGCEVLDGVRDSFAIVSDDRHQMVGAQVGGCVEGVRKHGATGQGVQNFRSLRSHSGTCTRSENDHGGLHRH